MVVCSGWNNKINVSWNRVDEMINISLYRVYEKRNCCLNDE